MHFSPLGVCTVSMMTQVQLLVNIYGPLNNSFHNGCYVNICTQIRFDEIAYQVVLEVTMAKDMVSKCLSKHRCTICM